ncbi:MAG: alpha/beta hydrolase fold protein [Chloroflexi bacterium]|nr:alpha/beta hydrolase fold protein [Chloroflexota bacterium]
MWPLSGSEIEVRSGGSGPRIVLLHGAYGWWGWEPVHQRLAERFTVVAPSHPGFGSSPRLPDVDTVDDLAYLYLDLIAARGILPARLVGFGFGGWLAAEIAVRCPHAVERLILVDSVGIKTSGREGRDIEDPFVLVGDEQQRLFWADPSRQSVPLPHPDMNEDLLEAMLSNQEAAMLYGWKPFFHNPKLKQRLHRITAPSLVVWGEEDRIVSPAYGKAFADSIPGARFVTIPGVGHYPHREGVEPFVQSVVDFLG